MSSDIPNEGNDPNVVFHSNQDEDGTSGYRKHFETTFENVQEVHIENDVFVVATSEFTEEHEDEDDDNQKCSIDTYSATDGTFRGNVAEDLFCDSSYDIITGKDRIFLQMDSNYGESALYDDSGVLIHRVDIDDDDLIVFNHGLIATLKKNESKHIIRVFDSDMQKIAKIHSDEEIETFALGKKILVLMHKDKMKKRSKTSKFFLYDISDGSFIDQILVEKTFYIPRMFFADDDIHIIINTQYILNLKTREIVKLPSYFGPEEKFLDLFGAFIVTETVSTQSTTIRFRDINNLTNTYLSLTIPYGSESNYLNCLLDKQTGSLLFRVTDDPITTMYMYRRHWTLTEKSGRDLLADPITVTEFFAGVKNNDIETVELYLLHGDVNIDNPDDDDESIALSFVQSIEMLQMLIAAGADVNDGRNGETPLIGFASSEELGVGLILPMMRILLDSGADINMKALNYDRTVLFYCENMQRLHFVIEAGANLNATDYNGQTALMHYAATGDDSFVEVLMGAGADTTLKNTEGQTAFDLCKSDGCKDLLHPDSIFLKELLRESRAYIMTLSSESSRIVSKYTGSSYTKMNKCLRKVTTQVDVICNKELAELDRIITNGPVVKMPITVLRAFDPDKEVSKKLWEIIRKLQIGDIFEERAFMSTSYLTVTESFIGNKCCVMSIDVPIGVNILAVESVSNLGNKEKELLLAPGMGLQLTGISEDKKGRTIYQFNCRYCLPSQRYRSSVAPTHLLNVGSYREKTSAAAATATTSLPIPLAGTARYVLMFSKDGGVDRKAVTRLAKQLGAISPTNIVVIFDHGQGPALFNGAAIYSEDVRDLVAVPMPLEIMSNSPVPVLQYIVSYQTDIGAMLEGIEHYDESQPIYVSGLIDNGLADMLVDSGFRNILPTANKHFMWYARGANMIPVHSSRNIFGGDGLVIDFIGIQSKLRPSTKKLPPQLSRASSKLYGFIGDPSQFEKALGCPLFTDSCMGQFKNYDTKELYTIPQPMKQYIVLIMHHLCSVFGKYVVVDAVKDSKIPYMISGTTAINYWIQTLAEGKTYKLPVIPTQDFDFKMDMAYAEKMQSLLEARIAQYHDQMLQSLQIKADTPIRSLEFKWLSQAGGQLRTLLVYLDIPSFTALTNQPHFIFPIVDLSSHTGVSRVDDHRIRLSNGLYLATPEYVMKDLCKGWGQSYKAKRREAKLNCWNMVFPSGHRLHQNNKFPCD
jgi:hypothetical protein